MNLTVDPPMAVITIADIPPYNNYRIHCFASLPFEFQSININLTWLDMETRQPIQQTESVQIEKFSTFSLLDGETIVVYNSVLTVSEIRNGSYGRLCCVDVTLHDLNQQVTIYPEVATAHRTIVVRGEFIL